MSLAADYAGIMNVLVNDSTLKTLMNIATADKTNYKVLLDEYFLQTHTSDVFTNDGICRICLRNDLQRDTTNDYVKFNGVILEMYIPKTIDYMTAFQTRTNQITDRLIVLFNNEYINENKLKFHSSNELASSQKFFKRQYCKFEYKKIYR